MALILEWSIDTLCHFTTPRKKKIRSIVYSTKPRMDGFMEVGASVTCTAEEVNIKTDVGVTSRQKPCAKIIYIVLQTSVGLF